MIKRITVLCLLLMSAVLSAIEARVYWCDYREPCIETHQTAHIEIKDNIMRISYKLDDGILGLDFIEESYDIVSSTKTSIIVSDKSKKIILSESSMSIYDSNENYTVLYRFKM